MLHEEMYSLLLCQCTCSRLCCTYTNMAAEVQAPHAQLVKGTVGREGPLLLAEPALLHSRTMSAVFKAACLAAELAVLAAYQARQDATSMLRHRHSQHRLHRHTAEAHRSFRLACLTHVFLLSPAVAGAHSSARWSLHRSHFWCLAQVSRGEVCISSWSGAQAGCTFGRHNSCCPQQAGQAAIDDTVSRLLQPTDGAVASRAG